jgi:hypothetical protein
MMFFKGFLLGTFLNYWGFSFGDSAWLPSDKVKFMIGVVLGCINDVVIGYLIALMCLIKV